MRFAPLSSWVNCLAPGTNPGPTECQEATGPFDVTQKAIPENHIATLLQSKDGRAQIPNAAYRRSARPALLHRFQSAGS
jgi:hypothetical protein